jgi:hypothetical protein
MPMSPRLLRPILSGDPDALRYIAAVQQADQQSLEPAVRKAITDFVVGCKADGIWSTIKASCILMGARTLSGALVPLVGAAPTNNNFVGGDYDRKLGLIGNGSTKWLNSQLAYNAISSDNEHMSLYRSVAIPAQSNAIGGGTITPTAVSRIAFFGTPTVNMRYDVQMNAANVYGTTSFTGFVGASRAASNTFSYRDNGSTSSQSVNSVTRANVSAPYGVFVANYSDFGLAGYSAVRLAWYSIGSSITLSALDTRVSDLYTAIGNAIP